MDDDPAILRQLRWGLAEDFDVVTADAPDAAMQALREGDVDVVALDLALDGKDPETGFDLLERVVSTVPWIKVVMVTGHDAREHALRAVDRGAFDFFTKPIDLDELRILVKRAVQVRRLERENADLKDRLREEGSLGRFLGQSPAVQSLFRTIQKVAPTDVTVLVTGDSGTGKDLVAREIHRLSGRLAQPLVTVGCGALDPEELEAELFGAPENGGGGKLETARGGSLYLDEVEAIPLEVQARLARFLAQEELRRAGTPPGTPSELRLIASAVTELKERVASGTFRDDLYFRLSVVRLHLPPLRERKEDVVYLAQKFLDRYAPEFGRGRLSFSREALRSLQKYPWPGNVRELEHRVQRGIVMSRGRVIHPEDLELDRIEAVEPLTLREGRERGEREAIVDALRRNCGNIARAARDLEVSRPTLHDLLHKLDIRAADYKKGLGPREDGSVPRVD